VPDGDRTNGSWAEEAMAGPVSAARSACGQNYRPTRRHSVCGRPFAFRHTSAETFLVDGVQWRCNGLRNAEFAEQDI